MGNIRSFKPAWAKESRHGKFRDAARHVREGRAAIAAAKALAGGGDYRCPGCGAEPIPNTVRVEHAEGCPELTPPRERVRTSKASRTQRDLRRLID